MYRFQFKLDLLIIRNDFLANLSYIMWYIVLEVHPIAKNSLRLLGGPFSKGRPVEASGLRPSALASRPPALTILLSDESWGLNVSGLGPYWFISGFPYSAVSHSYCITVSEITTRPQCYVYVAIVSTCRSAH